MSSYVKGKGLGQEESRVHRIRITLTSKNVKNLEKGASAITQQWCSPLAMHLCYCPVTCVVHSKPSFYLVSPLVILWAIGEGTRGITPTLTRWALHHDCNTSTHVVGRRSDGAFSPQSWPKWPL